MVNCLVVAARLLIIIVVLIITWRALPLGAPVLLALAALITASSRAAWVVRSS